MACWCKGACPHVAEPAKELKAANQGRAESLLRRNLAEAPFCVEGNFMLAEIMRDSNRASFAEVHLDRAGKTGGQGARYWLERGRSLRSQGRPAEAVTAFEEARRVAPDAPEAWAGGINAHEGANELDNARELARLAREHFKGTPPAVRQATAQLYLAQKDYTGVVNLLGAGIAPPITPAERLIKGRALEKLGEFDQAWETWVIAKRELAGQGHVYWREHFMQLFAGLYEISQPARYKMLEPAQGRVSMFNKPLFVTGFPRSGTTMLESALGAHSEIIAGDEGMGVHDAQQILPRLVHSPLPYPHALMGLTLGDNCIIAALCRELYYRKTMARLGKAAAGGFTYVTDKMPMNDLHLPLIRLMFPAAPFLYLRRHPLDIVLSTMSHMITSGGHYAESLETIAEHYAGADGLLQHYKNVIPLGPFREVRYEKLVDGFEEEMGKVMALVELPLQPDQLTFHKSERVPRTISYSQVREPLYSTSVARYKNFLPHLEPALKWLEPIMAREGYNL